MTVEVTLQVTGINLRDDDTVARLAEHLDDYSFSEESGITTMTVFSDGDPVSDTIRAIRCAQTCDITVVAVKQDMVNVGEIARRVGDFSREAIRKWSLDPSFPTPADSMGGERASLMWHWADVVRWLIDAKGIDMDEELPDAKTVAHINAHIYGIRDYHSDAIHMHLSERPQIATVVDGDFVARQKAQWQVEVTATYRTQVLTNAR